MLKSLLVLLLLYNTAYSINIYNESCTVTVTYEVRDSCDIGKGFKCHPDLNVCRCYNETSMEYDPQQGKCIVQGFGSTCVDETKRNRFACEDKLECTEIDGNVYRSVPGCYCPRSYLKYVNASSGNELTCLPANLGLPCNNSFPCHESQGLFCSEGKCRCPHPASQFFTNGGCLGMPEFPDGCNLEENGREKHCFGESSCGEDKTCHCNPGYSSTLTSFPRHCKLDHGQPCKQDGECNRNRGLKCINEVCSCEMDSNIQYDTEQGICALSEGFPCDSKRVWSDLPCFTGLECRPTSDPFFEKCMKIDDDNSEDDNGGIDDPSNCNKTDSGKDNQGNEGVVLIFKMFK